jgi:hypothetical protein
MRRNGLKADVRTFVCFRPIVDNELAAFAPGSHLPAPYSANDAWRSRQSGSRNIPAATRPDRVSIAPAVCLGDMIGSAALACRVRIGPDICVGASGDPASARRGRWVGGGTLVTVRHRQASAPAKSLRVPGWSLVTIREIRSAVFSTVGGWPAVLIASPGRPSVLAVPDRNFLRGRRTDQQCERSGSGGSADDATEK